MTTTGRLCRTKRFIRGIKSVFCCFNFRRQITMENSPCSSTVREAASNSSTTVSKNSEVTGRRISQSGEISISTRHCEEMSEPMEQLYQNRLGQPWKSEDSRNNEPGTTSDNGFRVPFFGLDMSKCHIIASHNLKFNECVCQGTHAGLIYRGQLFIRTVLTKRDSEGDEVAIKTLQAGSYHQSLLKGLLKESCILSKFKHRNVLSLIGVCVDGGLVPFVVMPFMTNGNLLDFLDKESEHLCVVPWKTNRELTIKVENKLLDMCRQVAKGMKYLTSMGIIHRDLAARNCMVDSNFVIKLYNFGLCEKLEPSKNYLKHMEKDVKFSLNWMAPEIFNDGLFSEKTDVWAYGVTCWEIFSCGKIPYAQVDKKDLLAMLRSGYRMEKPYNEACSDKLYEDLHMKCWTDDPADRPNFSRLVRQIKHFIQIRTRILASIADHTVANQKDKILTPTQISSCPPWYSRENSHYEYSLRSKLRPSAWRMLNLYLDKY